MTVVYFDAVKCEIIARPCCIIIMKLIVAQNMNTFQKKPKARPSSIKINKYLKQA